MSMKVVVYMTRKKNSYIQQSPTNPNRVLNNAFPVNIHNNYQKKIEKNKNYPASQRYTIAPPFPSDNLLDLKGTNNIAHEFVTSEPQNKFSTAVKIKKIKNNRDISKKNLNSNTLSNDILIIIIIIEIKENQWMKYLLIALKINPL